MDSWPGQVEARDIYDQRRVRSDSLRLHIRVVLTLRIVIFARPAYVEN